ncbi:hypothetical protein L1887_52043 [Cichorium endivia]|nr:hypothetical protein L1887_52043 [Cichorium endivia]
MSTQCGRIQTLFFSCLHATRIWPFFFRTINQTLLEALEPSGLALCDGGVRIDTIFNSSTAALSRLPLKYRPRALVISMPQQPDDNSLRAYRTNSQLRSRNERGVWASLGFMLLVASVCVCVRACVGLEPRLGWVCLQAEVENRCLLEPPPHPLVRPPRRLRTLPRRPCQSDGSAIHTKAAQRCVRAPSSSRLPGF